MVLSKRLESSVSLQVLDHAGGIGLGQVLGHDPEHLQALLVEIRLGAALVLVQLEDVAVLLGAQPAVAIPVAVAATVAIPW